jgi:hypothetical protein
MNLGSARFDNPSPGVPLRPHCAPVADPGSAVLFCESVGLWSCGAVGTVDLGNCGEPWIGGSADQQFDRPLATVTPEPVNANPHSPTLPLFKSIRPPAIVFLGLFIKGCHGQDTRVPASRPLRGAECPPALDFGRVGPLTLPARNPPLGSACGETWHDSAAIRVFKGELKVSLAPGPSLTPALLIQPRWQLVPAVPLRAVADDGGDLNVLLGTPVVAAMAGRLPVDKMGLFLDVKGCSPA